MLSDADDTVHRTEPLTERHSVRLLWTRPLCATAHSERCVPMRGGGMPPPPPPPLPWRKRRWPASPSSYSCAFITSAAGRCQRPHSTGLNPPVCPAAVRPPSGAHSSPIHCDACTQPRLAAEGLCASLVVLNAAASARRGRARRWGELEAKASMWERADVVWVTAAATAATAGAAVFHTALSLPARRVSPAQGHGARSHEALVTHSRQGSAQPHCPGRAAGQSPGASRPWPLAVAAAAPAAAAGAAAGSRPSNERHGERRQGNCHRRR